MMHTPCRRIEHAAQPCATREHWCDEQACSTWQACWLCDVALAPAHFERTPSSKYSRTAIRQDQLAREPLPFQSDAKCTLAWQRPSNMPRMMITGLQLAATRSGVLHEDLPQKSSHKVASASARCLKYPPCLGTPPSQASTALAVMPRRTAPSFLARSSAISASRRSACNGACQCQPCASDQSETWPNMSNPVRLQNSDFPPLYDLCHKCRWEEWFRRCSSTCAR